MLGLGFNTKMLQAYLILPAVAAAVFIFSQGKFLARVKMFLIFLAIAAVVSFSWITIVDLTPSNVRPFVGGSENNSAWNLALGYNGSQRLFGENSIGGNPGFNVGEKGLGRLFTGEMGTQAGWLLAPVILFSVFFLFKEILKIIKKLLGKDVEITNYEIFTFMSIVFFVTEYLFFSYASFFHSYYLNIFAIPIAFLIGSMFWELSRANSVNKFITLALFIALPVQMSLVSQVEFAGWLIPSILIIGMVALLLMLFQTSKKVLTVGKVTLLISLFLAPLVWSGYTTLNGNTSTAIFIGGPNVGGNGRQFGTVQAAAQTLPMGNGVNSGGNTRGGFDSGNVNSQTLSYLKQNYNGEKYFVAVSSQQQATSYILNEDIGNIMTLGGFSGRDKAITLSELKEKIQNHEIRFFLLDNRAGGNGGFGGVDGGFIGAPPAGDGFNADGNITNNQGDGQGGGMFNANQDITDWVRTNCKAVDGITGLYDCKT